MSKNIRFTKNNLYAIINQNSRESMINMEIVKYKPEYKNDFIRLSKNWITKYFALESDDFEVFEHLQKSHFPEVFSADTVHLIYLFFLQ